MTWPLRAAQPGASLQELRVFLQYSSLPRGGAKSAALGSLQVVHSGIWLVAYFREPNQFNLKSCLQSRTNQCKGEHSKKKKKKKALFTSPTASTPLLNLLVLVSGFTQTRSGKAGHPQDEPTSSLTTDRPSTRVAVCGLALGAAGPRHCASRAVTFCTISEL